jgi:hypothetical protein
VAEGGGGGGAPLRPDEVMGFRHEGGAKRSLGEGERGGRGEGERRGGGAGGEGDKNSLSDWQMLCHKNHPDLTRQGSTIKQAELKILQL